MSIKTCINSIKAIKFRHIGVWLDDVFHKRIVITHHKELVQGDYLIDDRGKHGTSEFAGEWIGFGSDKFPDWNSVLDYLLPKQEDPQKTE